MIVEFNDSLLTTKANRHFISSCLPDSSISFDFKIDFYPLLKLFPFLASMTPLSVNLLPSFLNCLLGLLGCLYPSLKYWYFPSLVFLFFFLILLTWIISSTLTRLSITSPWVVSNIHNSDPDFRKSQYQYT